MVKRTGGTQEVLDRSAKRSKTINILSSDAESDSESDLPELDFTRSTRSSQKKRQAGQPAVRPRPRDSGYHSQPTEAEPEAEVDGEETLPGIDEARNRRNKSRHSGSL
jgi:hypothetical protein